MFALSRQENAAYRAIAMLVATALVLWAVGAHFVAEAANLTSVSNTLSDSDPLALSTHTVAFTVPVGSNGIDQTGETIVVTFPNGFNLSTSTVAFGDITLSVGGAPQTVAAAAAGATWGAAIAGQDLTLTTDTGTVTAGQEVIIGVGTDGTTRQVTNHSATTSYEFVIDLASGQDTGRTRVAIIDNVDVTARVDTTFDFVVSGFAAAGTDANGTTTTATSSSTEIPFGTLTAGVVETIAQRLNVTTNASQGYVVTVEQDQNLLSTVGDIDGFADGAYTNTPADWAAPTNNISNENTWGHWGLTSTDDLNATEFQNCGGAATGCWVAASTTPRQIMEHNGPADGTTNDVGSTTVAYQVEITPLQEAADDYQTTLTYIATPTF